MKSQALLFLGATLGVLVQANLKSSVAFDAALPCYTCIQNDFIFCHQTEAHKIVSEA